MDDIDLSPLFATPPIHTDEDGVHRDEEGREYVAVEVAGELTYERVGAAEGAGAGGVSESLYRVVDSRTGEPATSAGFLTRESAERHIEQWRERGRRGERPDAAEALPFLVVVAEREGEVQ